MSKNRQNYPKFSPKGQNKTNFRIKNIFWDGAIFENFRTVFPILSLFLKNAKIAIKWAQKPRRNLKITKNIENNPKLIKRK